MKDLQSLYLVLTIEYRQKAEALKEEKAEIGLVRPTTRDGHSEDDFQEGLF